MPDNQRAGVTDMSQTCHRQAVVLYVPRRGARGRNKAAAEGGVQRRGGWKPASSGGGGSPVRGGVRRLHGARGVTESFGKTAGKPRENRVSGAGNFRKSRLSVFSAPASRRVSVTCGAPACAGGRRIRRRGINTGGKQTVAESYAERQGF